MTRKTRGREIHGWLLLDKHIGISSNAALTQVKHIYQPRKAGHSGTLDPLASGLLPIAFGEATKMVRWVMDHRKSYEFTLRFGIATDSDDAEGKIVETSDKRPDETQLRAVLEQFVGRITQHPPIYSAIKVDGVRAYDIARANGKVELAPRQVEIDSLALIDYSDPDHARLLVSCGKGTYIRSLARDIARKLGSVGHVVELRRTKLGPFKQEDAFSLALLTELSDIERLDKCVLPIEFALDHIPSLALNMEQVKQLRHGRPLSLQPYKGNRQTKIEEKRQSTKEELGIKASSLQRTEQDGIVCVNHAGRLIGMAHQKAGKLYPVRLLNL